MAMAGCPFITVWQKILYYEEERSWPYTSTRNEVLTVCYTSLEKIPHEYISVHELQNRKEMKGLYQ